MSRKGKRKGDDDFIDDSDDSETEAPRKKAATRREPKKEADSADGVIVCELSKNRNLMVRQFKDMILIDIREHWTDKDGNRKPTRKGISLSVEQWKVLRNHIAEVDEVIDGLK